MVDFNIDKVILAWNRNFRSNLSFYDCFGDNCYNELK